MPSAVPWNAMTGRSPDEAAASGSPASAVTSNGAPATDSRDAGGFRAQPAALHPREVPRHGAAGRRTAGHDGPRVDAEVVGVIAQPLDRSD
jgi:hypothetical protein